MNRMIIIIVALVLIAGSVGAIWYFFLRGNSSEVAAETEEEKMMEPEFVDLEKLSISVIREGRVDRYITINVSLEMQNSEAKMLGDEALPRLKDAIFRDLHSYFSMQRSEDTGINVDQVKSRLMWAAERAIGKGKVREVIIQGAYERKNKVK